MSDAETRSGAFAEALDLYVKRRRVEAAQCQSLVGVGRVHPLLAIGVFERPNSAFRQHEANGHAPLSRN